MAARVGLNSSNFGGRLLYMDVYVSPVAAIELGRCLCRLQRLPVYSSHGSIGKHESSSEQFQFSREGADLLLLILQIFPPFAQHGQSARFPRP